MNEMAVSTLARSNMPNTRGGYRNNRQYARGGWQVTGFVGIYECYRSGASQRTGECCGDGEKSASDTGERQALLPRAATASGRRTGECEATSMAVFVTLDRR